jgi:hypothetical protein
MTSWERFLDTFFNARVMAKYWPDILYGMWVTIELAVLVDRGGRELPIAAQYCGASFEVPADQVLVLDRKDTGTFSLSLSATHRERASARPEP